MRSVRANTRSLIPVPYSALFRSLMTVFSQGMSILTGQTSVQREQVVQRPLKSQAGE